MSTAFQDQQATMAAASEGIVLLVALQPRLRRNATIRTLSQMPAA
jgi:hypothetical protein